MNDFKKGLVAASVLLGFATIRIGLHGYDFVPGTVPPSSFCAAELGSDMDRASQQEDLAWRGCLAASETERYVARYVSPNNPFGLKKVAGTTAASTPCVACHDNKIAPDFARLWVLFPRYNPAKHRLEGLAKAIQDELELRYGGTRPDRYDVVVSSLLTYAFTKAKLAGLTFELENPGDTAISEEEMAALNVTPVCREIFADHGGPPRGPSAAIVVKGCNLITDTGNRVPHLLKIWRTDMKCQSCHRRGGTIPNAAPLAKAAVLYPMVSTSSYQPIGFHRRSLMCFARSLNWLDLGRDSPLPEWVNVYANWLAQREGLQVGRSYPGRGVPMIYDTSGYSASIPAGERVYRKFCIECHGENAWGGQGPVWRGEEPPPIAGPNSYNASASMGDRARVAGFVYNNMPQGATPDHPVLTEQQALDVALYITSMGRPADFLHTNNVTTFFNYLWQNLTYRFYGQRKPYADSGVVYRGSPIPVAAANSGTSPTTLEAEQR